MQYTPLYENVQNERRISQWRLLNLSEKIWTGKFVRQSLKSKQHKLKIELKGLLGGGVGWDFEQPFFVMRRHLKVTHVKIKIKSQNWSLINATESLAKWAKIWAGPCVCLVCSLCMRIRKTLDRDFYFYLTPIKDWRQTFTLNLYTINEVYPYPITCVSLPSEATPSDLLDTTKGMSYKSHWLNTGIKS